MTDCFTPPPVQEHLTLPPNAAPEQQTPPLRRPPNARPSPLLIESQNHWSAAQGVLATVSTPCWSDCPCLISVKGMNPIHLRRGHGRAATPSRQAPSFTAIISSRLGVEAGGCADGCGVGLEQMCSDVIVNRPCHFD